MKSGAKQVNQSTEKKVLALVRKGGILRPQDLQEKGLPSDYLWRLHKQGKLEKVGRGMYVSQDAVAMDGKRIEGAHGTGAYFCY